MKVVKCTKYVRHGLRYPTLDSASRRSFTKRIVHVHDGVASNFQTRERAKRANSSLVQVDTNMVSEIALLSQSASTTRISVVNSDWLNIGYAKCTSTDCARVKSSWAATCTPEQ